MANILIATAGPPAAHKTAEYLLSIAKRFNAGVTALHVLFEGETAESGEETLRIFQGWGQKLGVPVDTVLSQGEIVEEIIENSHGHALIVMGASEGRVVSEWLSSNVRHKCEVPVLVVPPEASHLS